MIFELVLDIVKMNQLSKYLGQRSFSASRPGTQDRFLYLDHKK